MQYKNLMILIAFVTFPVKQLHAIDAVLLLGKVLHDYEHVVEHHEGKSNDLNEDWVVEQDAYQEQDSYNNSSAKREGELSVLVPVK